MKLMGYWIVYDAFVCVCVGDWWVLIWWILLWNGLWIVCEVNGLLDNIWWFCGCVTVADWWVMKFLSCKVIRWILLWNGL